MFPVDEALRDCLRTIKLFAMDFDGVHTDGRVYASEDGKETVVCSRRDSMGLELLRRKTDIARVVISKEVNPVVAARCKKLKLPCHHGIDTGDDKLLILERVASELGIDQGAVAYMGDDVVDIAPMRWAGLAIAVGDAHPLVKQCAHIVTKAPGGNGAIREVCDLILTVRDISLSL